MYKAKEHMCNMFLYPEDERFAARNRHYQGCPTLAITRGGRFYAGWRTGGIQEGDTGNYVLLVYSDDKGKTWSDPILVVATESEQLVYVTDIQIWISPENKLFVFWSQEEMWKATKEDMECGTKLPWGKERYRLPPEKEDRLVVDGYVLGDWRHAGWMSVCQDPEAPKPEFTPGRFWDTGFLRNKPLVMSNGDWLFWNYDQTNVRYGYSITSDKGKTFTHYYGAEKLRAHDRLICDETMAYEKADGSIRMFARNRLGQIAEAVSADYARTWGPAKLTGIANPDARFYIGKLPSGRVLLVNSDHNKERRCLTVYLSEDDGETWKYKRLVDDRYSVSYPDVDLYEGRIYLVYDFDREGKPEILLTSFTEEDIMKDDYQFDISIINR